jgi:hypothetical protein
VQHMASRRSMPVCIRMRKRKLDQVTRLLLCMLSAGSSACQAGGAEAMTSSSLIRVLLAQVHHQQVDDDVPCHGAAAWLARLLEAECVVTCCHTQ